MESMSIRLWKFLCMVLALCFVSMSPASDYAKEKRWAEQIADALLDGEPHYLNANGLDFLTIHTEPDPASTQGVVLLHGIGIHPDWQTVIYPLRVELATQGWHTLSIQMPVLANDAQQQDYIELYPDVIPRIEAALKYLREQGVDKLFLVGHSLGASMGAYYLHTTQAKLNGFIAIGLSTGIKDTTMDNLSHLAGIPVPTLDLYGSDDLDNVVDFADLRNKAANPAIDYTQISVNGADHFFDGEEAALLETVTQWLKDF